MMVVMVWLRVSLWVWVLVLLSAGEGVGGLADGELMARRELFVRRQWRRWYVLQTCTDEGNLEGRELNPTVDSHKSARLGGWLAGDA
jgi:hypothetical protein